MMTFEQRARNYRAQTGRSGFTPRQRRRAYQKLNREITRLHGRTPRTARERTR